VLKLHYGRQAVIVWKKRDCYLAALCQIGFELPSWTELPGHHKTMRWILGKDGPPSIFAIIFLPAVYGALCLSLHDDTLQWGVADMVSCLNDKSRRSTGVLQRLNSAVRLIQRTTQGGSSRHYVLHRT
jgi:hypothetical protein